MKNRRGKENDVREVAARQTRKVQKEERPERIRGLKVKNQPQESS